MLMPKENRKAVYEYLFKEGVCVAKKDYNLKSHPSISEVPNLHVIKACKSLASRNYVKEQFAWRHHYWYLTNEGINYLREYLSLPPEIVPATLKSRPRESRLNLPAERVARGPKMDSDRAAYRAVEKATDAGPGTSSLYRGGYGRGSRPL